MSGKLYNGFGFLVWPSFQSRDLKLQDRNSADNPSLIFLVGLLTHLQVRNTIAQLGGQIRHPILPVWRDGLSGDSCLASPGSNWLA